MTTNNRHTGKPRCGVRRSLIKDREELVAYSRIITLFVDEKVEPMPREALIVNCDRWKVLPTAYGPRSERRATIGRIIDHIIEGDKILVEGPLGAYYLWHDARLDAEVVRCFGKQPTIA